MDVPNPLFWDLLWLFAFGVVPLLLGVFIARKNGGSGGSPRLTTFSALALVLSAGVGSSLPAPQQSTAIALFGPNMQASEVFAAMDAVGARVLWSDSSGQVWAFKATGDHSANALYRHGALVVSSTAIPLGCLNWTKI